MNNKLQLFQFKKKTENLNSKTCLNLLTKLQSFHLLISKFII